MSRIKNILANYKIRFKKTLGQNFLKDSQALQEIAHSAALTSDDYVFEIGAGIGNLSVLLAEKVKKLYLLEKDRAFEPILRKNCRAFKNTEIIFTDILRFKLKDIYEGKKLKVIGNLPFYITSPILKHLLEQRQYIDSIIITVQQEVGKRIIALPGSKDYGRLTCLLQFYTKPVLIETFPKYFFFPRPEVNAALLKLKMLDAPSVKVRSDKVFFDVVRAIFSHRRKTLLNSFLAAGGMGLKKDQLVGILDKLNISHLIRGEQLSLAEIGRLADEILNSSA